MGRHVWHRDKVTDILMFDGRSKMEQRSLRTHEIGTVLKRY